MERVPLFSPVIFAFEPILFLGCAKRVWLASETGSAKKRNPFGSKAKRVSCKYLKYSVL